MSDLFARLHDEASRGDVATFSLGDAPAVVLSHPRHFRQVLVDSANKYGKTRKERPFFGNGLLTSEGAEWATQRKSAMAVFAADPGRQRDVLARAVGALVDGWSQPGVRDVVPDVSRFILRVLGESLFEMDLGADAAMALVTAVETLMRSSRHQESMAVIADLARHIREHGRFAPFFDQPDQITTFLLAGTETSANTLSWALHLLSGAPEVAESVRSGGETAATAVVNETLRLYPPLWIITREVRERDVIDDVVLEPGMTVFLFVYRVQRDERFWDEPDAFRPDRFGGRLREPYAFVPFGSGQRICAGRRFAMSEVVAAVSAVSSAYVLGRSPGAPPVVAEPSFTLHPAGPVPVSFTPLRQPAVL